MPDDLAGRCQLCCGCLLSMLGAVSPALYKADHQWEADNSVPSRRSERSREQPLPFEWVSERQVELQVCIENILD